MAVRIGAQERDGGVMGRVAPVVIAFVVGVSCLPTDAASGAGGGVGVGTSDAAAVRGARSQVEVLPDPPMTCVPGSMVHRAEVNGAKLVALTFDDGPSPDNTERIMTAVERYGGRATFFMIGGLVERHPTLARSVRTRGHEVGNHTYNHYRDGTRIAAEIEWAGQRIGAVVGKVPRVFRSPGLVSSEAVRAELARLGMCNFSLSIDSGDSMPPNKSAEQICNSFKAGLKPGAIMLMHDGGSLRNTTIAIPCIVSYANAQGYRLVTLSELLGQAYWTT